MIKLRPFSLILIVMPSAVWCLSVPLVVKQYGQGLPITNMHEEAAQTVSVPVAGGYLTGLRRWTLTMLSCKFSVCL